MPCLSRSNSVAANATGTTNLAAGEIFEFFKADALLGVGLSQSATGLSVTVNASERLLANNMVPIVKATTPVKPDDFVVWNEPVLAGERLAVYASNSTAGAITLLWIVCIDEQ